MRRLTLFKLEIPYREPLRVEGFEFGERMGLPRCAIVGSTRGDEVQQAYVCAHVVKRLQRLEERGAIRKGVRILVIPCANPLSMNIDSRFWPTDGTDINRCFPGDAYGETTERVAAGIFAAVRGSEYGIQLASFNQQGDFLPHVRVTRVSTLSDESLFMARDFELPCIVSRDPTPFDTGTLNYSWQEWGTHTFSLYSQTTDRIDRPSAELVGSAIMRFLVAHGMVVERVSRGDESTRLDESALVDIRTEASSGYLESLVEPGERVRKGQGLGRVLDAFDAHVRERMVSPITGRIFFCRVGPLIQQRMVAYRIAPA